jgi:hypothetical protein
MKLPESERERIRKRVSESLCPGSLKDFMRGELKKEASLWLERMGKFAEWADENYFRRKTVNGDMWSEGLEADPKYTTPELIELFLNSLK